MNADVRGRTEQHTAAYHTKTAPVIVIANAIVITNAVPVHIISADGDPSCIICRSYLPLLSAALICRPELFAVVEEFEEIVVVACVPYGSRSLLVCKQRR